MSHFDDNEEFLTGQKALRDIERIHMATTANANNQKTKLITGEVRLAFIHALEPDSFNGNDPKFSVVVMIPKSDKKLLGQIKAAVDAAIELGKETKWGGKIPKKLRKPLRDGDEDMADYPEFEDHFFMRVSSLNAPGIIDRYKNEVTDSNGIYSGCWGRVSMNMFPYSASGNNGVSAGLNNIQVLRDGEPFGGRSRAEDDFDDDFLDEYEDDDIDDLLS